MSRTAKEVAVYLGATVEGDGNIVVSGVAGPEKAGAEDLIYLDAPKNRERVVRSAAQCVVVKSGTKLNGKTTIAVENAKLAFAKAATFLLERSVAKSAVHPTAIVASSATVAAAVSIGPYVVIEDEVRIGEGTVIDAFCFVGKGNVIGANCRLHPRVTLYAGVQIGDRAEIHSGVVIGGGDGFGYVFGEGRHWKFPQIGRVEIGNDVEIGCNSTIDRGSLGDTRITDGVKIDNLVQVAHNVEIGAHTVIAAQTGISGSSILGSRVMVGGQAGIGDHCHIEDGASVGGQAGVVVGKTVRSGEVVWGTPARPLGRFKQQYGWFARLPELAERVRKLEESEDKEKGS